MTPDELDRLAAVIAGFAKTEFRAVIGGDDGDGYDEIEAIVEGDEPRAFAEVFCDGCAEPLVEILRAAPDLLRLARGEPGSDLFEARQAVIREGLERDAALARLATFEEANAEHRIRIVALEQTIAELRARLVPRVDEAFVERWAERLREYGDARERFEDPRLPPELLADGIVRGLLADVGVQPVAPVPAGVHEALGITSDHARRARALHGDGDIVTPAANEAEQIETFRCNGCGISMPVDEACDECMRRFDAALVVVDTERQIAQWLAAMNPPDDERIKKIQRDLVLDILAGAWRATGRPVAPANCSTEPNSASNPLDRACPTCGEPAGEPCCDPEGRNWPRGSWHVARVQP